MSDFKKLSAPLSADEIEMRIGSGVSDGRGFSLLAYKTARVDAKRLDDAFGVLWKNNFFYDTDGLLCCEISIYDKDTQQWIGRCDVGTESKTEKEKGLYSDAFKRAGFKWGIGAELYNFPSIWIEWDNWDNKNGKKYPKFYTDKIVISEYENENGFVKKLKLEYDGKVIYEFGKRQQPKQKQKEKEDVAIDKRFDLIMDIEKLIIDTGTSKEEMLNFYRIDSLDVLDEENLLKVKAILVKKKTPKAA